MVMTKGMAVIANKNSRRFMILQRYGENPAARPRGLQEETALIFG